MPTTKPLHKFLFIKIPLYHQDIIISINQTDKELSTSIKKSKIFINKENIEKRIEDILEPSRVTNSRTAARAIMYDNGGMMVRTFDDLDINTPYGVSIMSHEIVHICSYIFKRIGMNHNDETDEAYAYLMGHILKTIYEQL